MDFGIASYGLGLVAGVLSTLSPCVLPIIPILLGSATNAHPKAPLVLAGGLAISYALVGTFLASAGAAFGFDPSIIRNVGAVLFGVFGLVLISGALQQRFASATANIGNAGSNLIANIRFDGLWGQFVIGLVLGVVWSPCVGPTLGAAIVLASQGTHLLQVALLMGVFGIGAALPIIVLAYVSRSAMVRLRGRLMQAGKTGKTLLGGFMIAIAVLMLSGLDRPMEAWLVEQSPAWLTHLTTRY
ncbi:cytochrome c biogenesis CcdA family protein [Propionivibrio dicarboxylicus]|uniref:Cytochrome c biogenesis protein CcdA n=1 Tax=Propionivibrio dicarboxylicus TaxID=83767 RepID=A0A1G8EWU4_9RHOO|nr:cytochrome c biogenesis CcdA family protein [Propionivibrio dicarboxylicus]SDH74189.1 Cytochrome c biogenesis protein CcdA [Propionivibrio dicarboxylicus]